MRELGDLVVDLSERGDRATSVYRALLEAVRGGRLRPGERLPLNHPITCCDCVPDRSPRAPVSFETAWGGPEARRHGDDLPRPGTRLVSD